MKEIKIALDEEIFVNLLKLAKIMGYGTVEDFTGRLVSDFYATSLPIINKIKLNEAAAYFASAQQGSTKQETFTQEPFDWDQILKKKDDDDEASIT